MSITQTTLSDRVLKREVSSTRWRRWLRRAGRPVLLAILLLIVLVAVTSTAPSPTTLRNQRLAATVAAHQFDWTTWQWQTVVDKVQAQIDRPAHFLSGEQATVLVRDYVQRAQQIGALEGEINRHQGGASGLEPGARDVEIDLLLQQIDALRGQQLDLRPTVEQVIERQVAEELVREGLSTPERLNLIPIRNIVLPPVRFAFTEPPKQLIVSHRDRIERVYGHTVAPEIDADDMATAEARIREQGYSGYVTNVGGLGTFPTMVVDRASLRWIVSTVAHEWVHNYLIFFPLGAAYGESAETVIINESVAEIIGNEIGTRVLQRHYPDLAPAPLDNSGRRIELPVHTLPVFDFRVEMQQTRLRVDALLAAGQIEEAEAYMEHRRQDFVEHGYPLRVLNQAYFAFHGSYSTSAASSSEIGPKLDLLRAATPNLRTFLRVVRPVQTEAELDGVLARYEIGRLDD